MKMIATTTATSTARKIQAPGWPKLKRGAGVRAEIPEVNRGLVRQRRACRYFTHSTQTALWAAKTEKLFGKHHTQ
jgi:hypothetical protein